MKERERERDGEGRVPPLLDVVGVEEGQSPGLEVPAATEIAAEERAEDGDEVTIVVLEALGEPAPLGVELGGLQEEGVPHGLELRVEHHPVHDVVQHQLQPPPHDHALRPRPLAPAGAAQVRHRQVHLLLPHPPVLLHHLVCEEGQRHHAPHLPPVVAVDGEHHVLPAAGEDVEDHVPRPRAELDPLRVEHLGGELRFGDHHQVPCPQPEEEDAPYLPVIAHLQPVAEHRQGQRTGWEVPQPPGTRHDRGDYQSEEGREGEPRRSGGGRRRHER
ncbi:unnamed protein product [Spirodela intermedia]|uniref:Uncharacterized protein n=1 Tax=Spirodela intermedia TaxID=51605 RepID=A0A7I8JM17_SPIIN|nr:unnamed protein product [Spirodela intermedia]CAA6671184.1 unnamed protein product [Spirodela intermedia]